MAELEWGLTEAGQADNDRNIGGVKFMPLDIVETIREDVSFLTVNGVPLRDVLAETASGLDDDIHGVGVILRDYDMSVAVLRALAEMGVSDD